MPKPTGITGGLAKKLLLGAGKAATGCDAGGAAAAGGAAGAADAAAPGAGGGHSMPSVLGGLDRKPSRSRASAAAVADCGDSGTAIAGDTGASRGERALSGCDDVRESGATVAIGFGGRGGGAAATACSCAAAKAATGAATGAPPALRRASPPAPSGAVAASSRAVSASPKAASACSTASRLLPLLPPISTSDSRGVAVRGLAPSDDARGKQAKQVPPSLGAASPPPSAATSASCSACDSSGLRSLGGDDGAAGSKLSAVGLSSATRGEAPTAPDDARGDSASPPTRLIGACSSGGVSQDSAPGADELRRASLGGVCGLGLGGAHKLAGRGLVAAEPGATSSSEEVKSSAAGAQRPPLNALTLVTLATVLPQADTPLARKPKNPVSSGGAIGSARKRRTGDASAAGEAGSTFAFQEDGWTAALTRRSARSGSARRGAPCTAVDDAVAKPRCPSSPSARPCIG